MTTNISAIVKTSTIDTVGSVLSRYGLVIVIGWIGALKFAHYEAHQIQPLVSHSPFMGWLYQFLPVYGFSALLGVFEVGAALLLAIKPLAPKLSIVGSVLAIMLFVFTISFLFTTPGVGETAGGGFPALSLPGGSEVDSFAISACQPTSMTSSRATCPRYAVGGPRRGYRSTAA